jgi:prepilin-type N-terminal cleavage/methylation domain-containing protein
MKGSRGFTLLEMIVSMLIVSGIVLTVYTAYSTVVRTWEAGREQAAQFRLEAVGTRLLLEDWKSLATYVFSTERGTYPFFFGGPDRLTYVTTHGLGAHRAVRGGLFFTILFIAPTDEGVGLFCYKTDLPELELSDLVRLYHSGGQDAAVRGLETFVLDRARLLKEADDAAFSFDTTPGNETALLAEESVLPPQELELLPRLEWTEQELPRRVRFSLRRGEEFGFIEVTRPEETNATRAVNSTEAQSLVEMEESR